MIEYINLHLQHEAGDWSVQHMADVLWVVPQ